MTVFRFFLLSFKIFLFPQKPYALILEVISCCGLFINIYSLTRALPLCHMPTLNSADDEL